MRWMLLGALVFAGCAADGQDDSLIVSPGMHDFGPVAVGQSAEATFRVWNPTMETQTLSVTVAPNVPEMLPRLGSCGVTLAAGDTCTVVVKFAPTAPGDLSGVLAVRPGSTVALLGTGVR